MRYECKTKEGTIKVVKTKNIKKVFLNGIQMWSVPKSGRAYGATRFAHYLKKKPTKCIR